MFKKLKHDSASIELKKIMVLFQDHTLGIKTVSCRLLRRMEMMDIEKGIEKIGAIFLSFIVTLPKITKE